MARESFEGRRNRRNSSVDAAIEYSRRSSDRRALDRSSSRDRDRRRHADAKRHRNRSRSPYHRDSGSKDSYSDRQSRKRDSSPDRSYKRQRRYSSMSRSSRDDSHEPRRRYSRPRSPKSQQKKSGDTNRRYSDRSMSPPRRKRSSSHKHHRHSRHSPSLSLSPPPRPRSPPPSKRSSRPLPSQQDAYTSTSTSTSLEKPTSPPSKEKPNYAPTGILAAETNTVANTSIVLKYHEPPDARLPPPSLPHLLYIFKSSSLLQTLQLHERSCWLFGREKVVADVAIEHPSCSKQHAVLQFRYVVKKDEWGEKKGGVKLYVLDLDSANGSWLNGERVEGRRYVEVRHKDVLRWGSSEREYVVLVPEKEGKEGS